MTRSLLSHACALLLWTGLASSAHAGACVAAKDAAAATADLYAMMSARDECALQYVPAEGFDETDAHGSRHRLTGEAFRALYAGGARIDLRAEELGSAAYGNVAVVAGVRAGGVFAAGADNAAARVRFTMVWVAGASGWQLHHVHFSAPQ